MTTPDSFRGWTKPRGSPKPTRSSRELALLDEVEESRSDLGVAAISGWAVIEAGPLDGPVGIGLDQARSQLTKDEERNGSLS